MTNIIVWNRGELLNSEEYSDAISGHQTKEYGAGLPSDLRIGDWIVHEAELYSVARKIVRPLSSIAQGYEVTYLVWLVPNLEGDKRG